MSFDLKIVNGDFVVENSDLSVVKGNDKLSQDVLKIALTAAGANPLHPWYGSLVNKTLIGSYLDSDIVFSVARTQLQNALDNLKNLQNLQVSRGQKVSPTEQIAFISDISITRNQVDPRLIYVVVRILDRAFGKVAVSFSP